MKYIIISILLTLSINSCSKEECKTCSYITEKWGYLGSKEVSRDSSEYSQKECDVDFTNREKTTDTIIKDIFYIDRVSRICK